jgi:hypothetical protein
MVGSERSLSALGPHPDPAPFPLTARSGSRKYAHLAPENVRAAVAALEDHGHDSVTQEEQEKKKPPVRAAVSLKVM